LPRTKAGIGPHSKLLQRGVVDGRTEYGRFLAAVRAELTQHLGGGDLTPNQETLIDRVAWLKLHVTLFDQKVARSGRALSERDRRSYLAFSNSLVRTQRELGLHQPAGNRKPVRTMADLRAEARGTAA